MDNKKAKALNIAIAKWKPGPYGEKCAQAT